METGEIAALDSKGSYTDAAREVKQGGGADRRKEGIPEQHALGLEPGVETCTRDEPRERG